MEGDGDEEGDGEEEGDGGGPRINAFTIAGLMGIIIETATRLFVFVLLISDEEELNLLSLRVEKSSFEDSGVSLMNEREVRLEEE